MTTLRSTARSLEHIPHSLHGMISQSSEVRLSTSKSEFVSLSSTKMRVCVHRHPHSRVHDTFRAQHACIATGTEPGDGRRGFGASAALPAARSASIATCQPSCWFCFSRAATLACCERACSKRAG